MDETVAHRCGGTSNVHQRHDPLQHVGAGLVEEVAQANDACCFLDDVSGQPGPGSAEQAYHGIQFAAAALQVRASDRKGRTQSCRRRKQCNILLIPEPVLAGYRAPPVAEVMER